MVITIDKSLKEIAPQLSLGIITANVKTSPNNSALWVKIEKSCAVISAKYKIEQVNQMPRIQELRSIYKFLGKDPSRYRGSSEALIRRVLQGKGLYKVNTIVDINNLVSLETLFSMGSYDLEKIELPFAFRIGLPDEMYKGIGKDIINITNLPVFTDKQGPFGSPTSDSERAMITEQTSNLMMIVISFSGCDHIQTALERAVLLLETFASASQIVTVVIN
jgi:DNA/RNA-binding domain of Phe-tRNA-synthetase-like protein